MKFPRLLFVPSARFFPLFFVSAATANANSTFTAYFNNGTGSQSDKTAAVYNWAGSIGIAGTEINSPASTLGVSRGNTSGAGVPVLAGQSTSGGFLFGVPGAGVAPGAIILYRTSLATSDFFQDAPQGNWFRQGSDSLNGLRIQDIGELSVYSLPANAGTVMRFAIRVSGVWHASATSFTVSGANGYEKLTINPSAVNWISDVYLPNSSLDDDLSDNPSGPLSPTSVITAYGWYADTGALTGADARVRIDSYEIKLPVTDPYLVWIAGFTDLVGPNALENEDPDGDGMSNLFEFITASLPNDPASVFPPAVAPQGGGVMQFSYRRSVASEPLAPTFELSTTLDSWQNAVDGENGVTIIPEIVDTSTTLFRVNVPSSIAARFGRLKVTR